MPCSKESAFERLQAAHDADRLPHAHLLTGAAGSGKTWLATRLTAHVLGCTPEAALVHPDAHFVQPESKSRRIVIDQVRGLERVIQRKPLLGSAKVAVLQDADRLQPAAANAFLKTLEEPPPGTILILTSSLPEALLETVVSRCVETALTGETLAVGPDAEKVLAALSEALGEPGAGSVASAFRLTRAIQEILADVRATVSKEHEALLKQESARYKNAADSADWLEERETQIKALAESSALRERERVVGVVLLALGGALRIRHGVGSPHPVCETLAARFETDRLLHMIDLWQKMQRRLAMNVNEALTLEAGFLEIVSAAR